MNFFKLYPGDYQRDTAHLSLAEHGAYLLMLQHYCSTERPLPAGKALHRMLRAQDKEERDAIDSVVRQFWHESPDGLTNGRAGAEINKSRTQAQTNRATAIAREAARRVPRAEHESCSDGATNDGTKTALRARNHSHSQIPKPEREREKPRHAPVGAALTQSDLEEEGVDAQHARDWLAVRKAKRLPLTRTAWEKFRLDAARQGMQPPAAVELCAGKGWAGFYAESANGSPGADIFAGAK